MSTISDMCYDHQATYVEPEHAQTHDDTMYSGTEEW